MALLCLAAVAAAPAQAASKEVRYGRYAIRVPASWPVYDLAERPATCVRFDRHAVYLGSPGAEQRCPAHAVGRSEAILVEPRGSAPSAPSGPSVRAPRRSARPAELPRAGASRELRVDVPAAGVAVTATWRDRPRVVRRILEGAKLASGGAVPAPRRQASPAPKAAVSRGTYHTGLGFDACTAPSRSGMSAWASSPYSAVGIYIGGVNRGCSQPNLTSGWVRGVTSSGWALIPIYVGLQAPGTSCNCATISRRKAKVQGRAAARDAMADARAVGVGQGNPIYFDMEYYARSSTNSRTALRFLAGWTKRLHSGGYVSGVYSSASAGIRDLVGRYGSRYREPDDIWIANWDGRRTTDDPYVPDGYWSNHQRIRQFRGSHNERYGGYTINIDSNAVDGAVAGAADRDGDGVPDDFDICATIDGPPEHAGCPYPSHVSGGLVRYLDDVDRDAREGDLLATTGRVGAAYRFQANLGFLASQELPGTIPLYGCNTEHDQFLSREADCGGAKVLDTEGYAYADQPGGVPAHPVFRCRLAGLEELTASYDPQCDSPDNVAEDRLGYTISVATLARYVSSVDGGRRKGDRFTTTAVAGPRYRFQANLGFLANQQVPGTVPLYSCSAGRDQFLSRDSGCEGAEDLGLVGYAYDGEQPDFPTHGIFLCRRGATGDRSVSYDPACGGTDSAAGDRLGFTISVAPLGRYFDSVDGDRRKGDHLTTTGGVRPVYHFEGNVGFIFTQQLPGTAGLYSCSAHRDQFLSRDARCGGAKVGGAVGWIYSSAPTGTPSRAIYACRRKNGERFVSAKPDCRGSSGVNQGRLGYVAVTPLP